MSIIIEHYGQWTNNNTLIDKRSTPIISRRRKNLHQATLRVAMVTRDNKSLAELYTYKTPNVNTIPKADFILTQVILEYFNCTGSYLFTDTFGGPAYTNTPPKGIFKLVLEKKADIGSSFLVMASRLNVKYIFPSSEIQAKIIFRRPRLSYVENLFTLTFAGSTWIAIAVLTLVIIILLAVRELTGGFAKK
ncbi:uncharacterized protein LOC123298819 [Chrysoperla carnea]|uniref:uncharacterized protein LOC123298819 n=1 Tax=Chrysoperla carnea TaxID=189513 RepID=UPI001D08C805|nr:uncharacterized protein LOC123298819 [Chrysoperla carnea]